MVIKYIHNIVMNISAGTIICMCAYFILLLSHNYYYNACGCIYDLKECPIMMHKNCKSNRSVDNQ